MRSQTSLGKQINPRLCNPVGLMCCVSLKQLDDGHLDPSDQSSTASAGQFEGPRGADGGLLWLRRKTPSGGVAGPANPGIHHRAQR